MPFTLNRSAEVSNVTARLKDMSAGGTACGCCKLALSGPEERGWRLDSRRGSLRGRKGGGSAGGEVKVEMGASGAR